MITKQHFKRFLAVLTFVTGCFLRTLPAFALAAFVVISILSYFVQWCYGWLSYIFTASERCMPNDIYNTKLTEYFLIIVYFACFFAMMYFTNPNRKKHPRKPPIQGELFND